MARKRYSDEDVLKLFRETEVPLASRSVRMQELAFLVSFSTHAGLFRSPQALDRQDN